MDCVWVVNLLVIRDFGISEHLLMYELRNQGFSPHTWNTIIVNNALDAIFKGMLKKYLHSVGKADTITSHLLYKIGKMYGKVAAGRVILCISPTFHKKLTNSLCELGLDFFSFTIDTIWFLFLQVQFKGSANSDFHSSKDFLLIWTLQMIPKFS